MASESRGGAMRRIVRGFLVLVFGAVAASALWALWFSDRSHSAAMDEAATQDMVVKATRAAVDGPFLATLDWSDWPSRKGNAYLSIYRSDPRSPGFDIDQDQTDQISKVRVRVTATDFHGSELDSLWVQTDELGWCELTLPFGRERPFLEVLVVPRLTTQLELVPTFRGSDSAPEAFFIHLSGEKDSDLLEGASVGMVIGSAVALLGALAIGVLVVLALIPFRSRQRDAAPP